MKKIKEYKKIFWDNFKILFFAFFLTIIIKTFFFQPFHIPSGSMKPGLLPGDYVFVNKFSYGFSKFSFGFYPSFLLRPDETNKSSKYSSFFPKFLSSNNRFLNFLNNNPSRGDVVVFVPPKIIDKNKEFYIKRIIGMPHDTIEIKNQKIYINGELLVDTLLNDKNKLDIFQKRLKEDIDESNININQIFFEEKNKDNISYDIMYLQERDSMDYAKFFIPENHYFVMGDNRDNSLDSRYSDVGFIPIQNIIGKASIVFLSIDKSNFSIKNLGDFFRVERFCKKIK
jgi:signal peptidase I